MAHRILNRWLAAISLALAAALPAQADPVTFEDVSPTLFSNSSITSGVFTFTSDGFGVSGVDSATSFVFGNSPPNAAGQFLFSLNNDGIFLERTNGAEFTLVAFDAAFIAPLSGLGAGVMPGELLLIMIDSTGAASNESFVFPASTGNGDFDFFTFAPSVFKPITAAYFLSCIYTPAGVCDYNGLDIPAQFALDNLRINVPEPATLVLAAAAFGILAARRARKQAA